MHTLTLLAHVSSEHHTHWEGVTFIGVGMAIVALWFYVRKTA